MTKLIICTTPIRDYPTDFPPFGSMAIIQSLRKNTNIEIDFYNIDYHRPSFEDVEHYFLKNKCQILAISAVVSTAYAYVKKLTSLIKRISPTTIIIVGGNLAASAEILHRFAYVDYCVMGDGEKIIVELVNFVTNKKNHNNKLEIKGISFLDDAGNFIFTGYGQKLTAEEVEMPDYKILEEDGSLDYFISESIQDRLHESAYSVEPGKRLATVVMTKGCVARCTFCHRWEKGFRALPTKKLKEHLEFLIKNHNVGFIQVADENFGSDKNMAFEIANDLCELKLLWQVAGVRTNTVTLDTLLHWSKCGCTSVYYGIESGSQKMLDIMEKKTTVEQNINALKWTGEANLNTIIQLIIGMPGEDDQTIEETINFLTIVAPHIRLWQNRAASDSISINYAQALPGTPLYEFGRENGLIGTSLESEEDYLLAISDTDAYSEDHFVNMTDQPLLKVLCWRKYIQARVDHVHYISISKNDKELSLFNIFKYYLSILKVKITTRIFKVINSNSVLVRKLDYVTDSGYFNINSGLKFSPLLHNKRTKNLLFPAIASFIVVSHLFRGHFKFAIGLCIEYANYLLGSHVPKARPSKGSLRKTVKITAINKFDEELRKGR